MDSQDLKLYALLGSKELSFGCYVKYEGAMYEGDEPHIARFVEYEYSANQSTGLPEYENSGRFSFTPPAPYGFEDYANEGEYEIIGHEPTIHDFHKWLEEKKKSIYMEWKQDNTGIHVSKKCWAAIEEDGYEIFIPYNSSLTLLQQSPETKQKLIDFIESNMTKPSDSEGVSDETKGSGGITNRS